MVIFLATISFVPSIGGGLTGTGNIGNIAGGNYVKGLNIAYEKFDALPVEEKRRWLEGSGNGIIEWAKNNPEFLEAIKRSNIV
jgi:hypothetical protein